MAGGEGAPPPAESPTAGNKITTLRPSTKNRAQDLLGRILQGWPCPLLCSAPVPPGLPALHLPPPQGTHSAMRFVAHPHPTFPGETRHTPLHRQLEQTCPRSPRYRGIWQSRKWNPRVLTSSSPALGGANVFGGLNSQVATHLGFRYFVMNTGKRETEERKQTGDAGDDPRASIPDSRGRGGIILRLLRIPFALKAPLVASIQTDPRGGDLNTD